VIRLKRTVVLVGLMGAGKTSVGKRLSELLKVPFFDSDDEIVSAAGMSIPEIFEKFGEEEFRRGETAVLARLVGDSPAVLSTGGGAFMSEINRDAISGGGVSVWLYRLADTVVTSTFKDTHDDVARSIVQSLIDFDKTHPERAVFERDLN